MEVESLREAVLGLQQEQADVLASVAAMTGELRNMAVAVTGLQQAAVSATPAAQSPCKQSSEPLANQSGLATPRVSPKVWQIGVQITLVQSISRSRTPRKS